MALIWPEQEEMEHTGSLLDKRIKQKNEVLVRKNSGIMNDLYELVIAAGFRASNDENAWCNVEP